MYRQLTMVLPALITILSLFILEGSVGADTSVIAARGGGGGAGAGRAGGGAGQANVGRSAGSNQMQRTPTLNRAAYAAGYNAGSTVVAPYYYPTTPYYYTTYPSYYTQPNYDQQQYVQPDDDDDDDDDEQQYVQPEYYPKEYVRPGSVQSNRNKSAGGSSEL
jgi:hypothetical protein